MSHDTKTSIAPMLSVRVGAKAVEFYKAAFGAVELFRIDAEDGAVVAQLSVDGAEFWVADVYVSLCQEKSTGVLGVLGRARVAMLQD